MKKRFWATAITGAMLCGILAGCGGGGGGDTTGGGSTGGDTAGGNAAGGDATGGSSYSMTFIMSQRDEFLSELEAAAQNAAKTNGISLSTQDANSDASKTIQFIESARNAGDDAVIVNMVDPATAQQCIEAAGDMKLVFVNRFPVDPTTITENSVYIGSDEMTSGKFQGDFLSEYFKAKGQTDIKYLLLNGILGQTSTENRTLSLQQAFKDNGINAELVSAVAADYERATAMDMITPLLKTTEYDCIVSNNDAMALGAIEAMTSQGLDPKSIPIVGIDATVDGREAIKNGTLAMSVYQNPIGQGEGSLIAAKNMLEGKAVNEGTGFEVDDENPNIVWVPFEPVTPDNVADYDNR